MVVMAGQAGTRQLFLMDEMWRAGAVCQTQPTEFTRFASEKYFVNHSSLMGEFVDISPKLYKT